MNPTLWNSFDWLQVADGLSLAGALMAAISLVAHWRASLTGSKSHAFSVLSTCFLGLTAVAMAFSVGLRWVEVNHFPSQNMNEVLVMFTAALVLSMLVLHFALGLHRRGAGWAILDDALLLLVFASAYFTHEYIRTLNTAQRDLPPALQSYWFPPHLSCLIFSYATLGIAGLVAIVYFATRFWSGVWIGGRTRTSQIVILGAMLLLPFAQVVTIPVLAIVGLVFLGLRALGKLPTAAAIAGLEKSLDDVSFRAFAVGIPFLTGGLWMGAFWAQEAWANYWGWDSKENSALITWLIYIVYVHLRMLGGYRGEKAMAVLAGGALSVFMTFQAFGYLPDSQKNSLHKYTDDGVVPREGMTGGAEDDSASAPAGDPAARDSAR
ncbi:MAG TPA: cytochrome c biogenesis protein CcsA [Planctomycetota bacterium]|nr:cytochrome c biogenesis protein CcsA [Planctomycetota bacterium]